MFENLDILKDNSLNSQINQFSTPDRIFERSVLSAFFEPATGFMLDYVSVKIFQEKFKFPEKQAHSINSACFMVVASFFASLCSIFQLFDGLGVSTVIYNLCHVFLIGFLYNSRYMALTSNSSPECQGRIIATSSFVQLIAPIFATLSTKLLEEVFEDDYDKLSKMFFAVTAIGVVFPVFIIFYRIKNK